MKLELTQKTSMRLTKMKSALLSVMMLLLMTLNLIAKENISATSTISDLKITIINNTLYFKWLACQVKEDGIFIIEEKNKDGYNFITFKPAIGVSINSPILYCATVTAQTKTNNSYRIKYVSINNDSLFSNDVKVKTNVSQPTLTASLFEEDFLRIKVLKDSLYDEVGIAFSDSLLKQSDGITKNFFDGNDNPHLFLKSNTNVPVCLKIVPATQEQNVIPLHFKHTTGGFFTMVFKKSIQDHNVKIYLDNILTKERTEIINQDSLTLYLSNPSDGKTPSFNLIFITSSNNSNETIEDTGIEIQKARKNKEGFLITSQL